MTCYTQAPANGTTVCVDELGPVSARTYPPPPGWSPSGHRIKAPLEYRRGYEKAWVYGALAVRTGQTLTLTTTSRNTAGYLHLLEAIDQAYPQGAVRLIADNLSRHTSAPVREWLELHPRITHVFIPVGACWLNRIEPWWRLFRRAADAGQSFADTAEIAYATHVATQHLNRRAHPWVWGRPPPTPRKLRRRFVSSL